MVTRQLAGAAALACACAATPALASSHREAPGITAMPKVDGTDFYMFRSYEKGRKDYVTLIANYQPLQSPYGGPNYFFMDPQAVYDINIDNTGRGLPDITFRFRFAQKERNLKLSIGGKDVAIPLIIGGKVGQNGSPADNANQNEFETYTLSLLSGGTETPISVAGTGATTFPKPLDNIGNKSLPEYADYADKFKRAISIPGCPATGKVFVGQRKDPFVVNLGQTFDLINYANPVGEQFNNSTKDDLADANVTSLILEVPIACLTNGSDPVIGAWTSASKIVPGPNNSTSLMQVSRLGNPLVNEVIIGLPAKDRFNASLPAQDGVFQQYFTNPTFPAIIESLFGTPAPTTFPRQDLVAVFNTGITGVNAPAHLSKPAEEMRLNTSIPATAYEDQKYLGVIGGDNAGYPNGRRPGDDVVDISLRVLMGRLYSLGVFSGTAPSGTLDFTDGAHVDKTFFDQKFPYLRTPLPGSP